MNSHKKIKRYSKLFDNDVSMMIILREMTTSAQLKHLGKKRQSIVDFKIKKNFIKNNF